MAKQDPRDLGLTAIPYPRALDLAVMIDLMLDLFFLGWNHVWPVFFCNGQHDFLWGERAEKEGGKNPISKLLRRPPHHMRLATILWGGEVHRKTPHKAALGSVLEPHTPLEWRMRPPPNGACPTCFGHYSASTRIWTVSKKMKRRRSPNCMLNKFF